MTAILNSETFTSYFDISFLILNLQPFQFITQVQGLTEHFRDKCGGPEGWLDDKTYYTAFTEGWALYAENPLIAQGTDIYKDNLMQKFGMLKWQVSYSSQVQYD